MDELAIIVDYGANWPEKFAAERALIMSALQEAANAIHHIGSTAIPGLAAKPVIDICIESNAYPPTDQLIQRLAALEYEHLGEAGVPGRHFFKKGNPRQFHIHLCPVGGAIAQSQLRLKSVLLRRPDLRDKYQAAKRAISGQFGIDRAEYVRLKEPIILEILNTPAD